MFNIFYIFNKAAFLDASNGTRRAVSGCRIPMSMCLKKSIKIRKHENNFLENFRLTYISCN